ncbi:MAG: choice-of-anchor B family protein [Ignavibacteria bacterium]|nr:choice-of-anchor B family protein [Ignavibacteria bacterium]
MIRFHILFLIFITYYSFAQLGNNNMHLIANKNDHFSNELYSAIWGYVAPNGREYAILGCPNGTAFYDVTDTSNVYECDFLPGLTSSWREMKVFGQKAYIVSEATGSGLQIVDLSYLPDSVRLLTTYSFKGYSRTHTISQSGPYLYLNGGDYMNGGIFVLDLSVSNRGGLPIKRGEWEVGYVHDCRIVNDTIWAAGIFDGYISIIDARDKNNLQTINRFLNLPDPGPHNTALTDDRKYLFVTDEIGGPSPRLLKVWNVQDVFNPVLVAQWQPTGITTSIVHNVEIYGNLALVAHYTAGVRLLNISNPENPVEIAWYDTYPQNNGNSYNGCWGVYMFPSGKIIASDRQTGLYVLKANILTGFNHNNSYTVNFSLKQNYPNPFNSTTYIEYELPRNAYITIKIYDIKGSEVSVLVDDYKRAGRYSVNYDASDLSSGIYIYTLQSGSYRISRKMILAK